MFETRTAGPVAHATGFELPGHGLEVRSPGPIIRAKGQRLHFSLFAGVPLARCTLNGRIPTIPRPSSAT